MQEITSSKINDINLLQNPFISGSLEYAFVEDYFLNTTEIGPGSFDKMVENIHQVDYESVKGWSLKTLSYYVFLRCSYWKIIATECKRRAGYKCVLCGSKRDLQTHHPDYDFHGEEHMNMDKLQCVCNRCHLTRIHGRDIIETKRQKQLNKLRSNDEIEDQILKHIPAFPGITTMGLRLKMAMSKRVLEEHLTNLMVRGLVFQLGAETYAKKVK